MSSEKVLESARFSVITGRSVNAFEAEPSLGGDRSGETAPFGPLGAVLDDVHEEASGLVTRLWGLPSEIQRVAATHHQLDVAGTPYPVNAALIVAEQLAGELDAGVAPAGATGPDGRRALDANPPELFEAACAAPGMDERRIGAARAEAAEIVAALSCAAATHSAAV